MASSKQTASVVHCCNGWPLYAASTGEAQLEKLGDLVADHVDREALMRLIDDGPSSGVPVLRLQATGFGPQEVNGDGSLTGAAEPAELPATTPKDLKAET